MSGKFIKPKVSEAQYEKWMAERKKRFPTRQKREENKAHEEVTKPKHSDTSPEMIQQGNGDEPLVLSTKKVVNTNNDSTKQTNEKKTNDIVELLMSQMQEQIQKSEHEVLLESIHFILHDVLKK
ncbi:hypothetical protein QTN25_008503 [Entamoeba marina]